MRSWFTWLLVFGVIAGLCGRVLSLDHTHGHKQGSSCHHSHEDGSPDHDHDHPATEDHSHDGCPPGPHEHHTHACCHPAPLAGPDKQQRNLVPPACSLLDVAWTAARPPDEPVFSLDKPPLI